MGEVRQAQPVAAPSQAGICTGCTGISPEEGRKEDQVYGKNRAAVGVREGGVVCR